MVKNNRMFITTLILFLIFFSYFFSVYYPTVGDTFDYWHMATAIYVQNSGHIDPSYSNAGYYVLTVIISEVANISYTFIPLLPFQSIPLILLLIVILKNIVDKTNMPSLIILTIMTVFITKFGNKSFFLYWSHGLGFLLFMLLLAVITFQFNSERKNQPAISLILILTIISLNFISYKSTAFTILFLIGLQTIEWFNTFQLHSKLEKGTFTTLIIIGVTYVLTFNAMFYNALIPSIRLASEETSGIYKLSLLFQKHEFDPLDNFYFHYPIEIRNLLMIWLLLSFVGLFSMSLYLLQSLLKKRTLHPRDKIAFGLLMSSFLMFLVYTLLGLSDFTYIVISSYICYMVIYANKINSKTYKHLVVAILISLLILNAFLTISSLKIDSYGGMKDSNYCQYLIAPSNWYINHIVSMNSIENQTIATDIFTGGYISKEIANEAIPRQYEPREFSNFDMLFLLNADKNFSRSNSKAFIINYRLKSFSAANWQTFNGWSNYCHLLAKKYILNNIYSSGDIDIYI